MNKLSIRVKIMLWYSLLTIILLSLFLPAAYEYVSNTMYSNQEWSLKDTATQATLACQEIHGHIMWIPEGITFSDDVYIYVEGDNGELLYSNCDFDWISEEPFSTDETWTKELDGSSWLVYDKIITVEKSKAKIRVCVSLAATITSLNNVKLIMLIAAPLYLLVAVLGSLIIARKALKPISKITDTASAIEKGDLSLRIEGIEARDEVGHLADTFNSMLEHLEESFHRERQFSSDASHELRTPVAIVMAYSEALIAKNRGQNGAADEDQLSALEVIHTESEKMNIIISQLLTLARGYEGKYVIELESIDLNAIINSVVEQLQETASESGIHLLFSPEDDLIITADQSLMTQLLINLVGNGIKYGKKDGYVRIAAKRESDGTHITIEDNGIGISEEDLPHIFDRFYRADKSRDRNGTGLGLSIVKWIVEEHHGTITAESAPDEGTIFSVVI